MEDKVKLVSVPIPMYANYCETCEVSFVVWAFWEGDVSEVFMAQEAPCCYLCGKPLKDAA